MHKNCHNRVFDSLVQLLYTSILLISSILSSHAYADSADKIALDVQLTQEERDYLELKTKLTHCADPNWMPYSKNKDGLHIGMSADYVELFSNTLGIPFEFVATESWAETIEKAQSRECDLIAALMDKPERREFLDFTRGYLDTSLSLATRSDAPIINNLQALDGKTIAVPEGYASTAYIKQKFPNLSLIEVPSIEDGLELVANNKSYGVAGTLGVLAYTIQNHYFNLIKINGTVAHGWQQSVGTRNDEPILQSIMNKVVSSISENTHKHIFSHWLSESVLTRNPNELTLNELEFLAHHPTIRFNLSADSAPFGFIDDQRKPSGLPVDYINNIAKRLGFKAEFVHINMTPNEAIEEMNLESRRFDTLALLVSDHVRYDKVNFGDVYLSYPMVIITHKNTLFINSLAELNQRNVVLEKGYLTNEWLARDYPKINISNVNTTKQALQQVNDAKADAYIGNLAIANYLLASGEMTNIKVAAPTEYGDINYSFVAPNRWPELASILSKGYRAITPAEHTAIRQKWFTLQRIEHRDYTLVVVVLISSIVLLIASALWNARVRREKRHTDQALEKLKATQEVLERRNEELKILSTTDALTGLSNRIKLENDIEYELQYGKRYQDHQFGVIMIDVDNFKHINDTYGHQTGDVVLKGVSSLFQNNIREIDYIGRWGGEEFLVVCPRVDDESLIKVAENLRTQLEHYRFPNITSITASFGASTFEPGDTSERLISRADKALYDSKEKGRNTVTLYKSV
jgi:polar amino acid transport system substrate-binding protein